MSTVRTFEETGIRAGALLAGNTPCLEVNDNGVLSIPARTRPTGFHLMLAVPRNNRTVVAQKNIAQDGGLYHRFCMTMTETDDFDVWIMIDPIEIKRAGSNVWTAWHELKSNNVNCWYLDETGCMKLFQVGIVTHDNGDTFRVVGEWKWQGQLYWLPKKCADGSFDDSDWRKTREVVGKPASPKWDSFSIRCQILDHPDMAALVADLINRNSLPLWTGDLEELNPSLDAITPHTPGSALVEWYNLFAGQSGQGIVRFWGFDESGEPKLYKAWIHGSDILEAPDPDGIKRLHRGNVIRYGEVKNGWGSKPNGLPKLTRVRRVR